MALSGVLNSCPSRPKNSPFAEFACTSSAVCSRRSLFARARAPPESRSSFVRAKTVSSSRTRVFPVSALETD